jgi:hypothetical protein
MKREVNSMEQQNQSGTKATPKVLSRRDVLAAATAIATVAPLLGCSALQNPKTRSDSKKSQSKKLTSQQIVPGPYSALAVWLAVTCPVNINGSIVDLSTTTNQQTLTDDLGLVKASGGSDYAFVTNMITAIMDDHNNALPGYLQVSSGTSDANTDFLAAVHASTVYSGNQCPTLAQLQAIAALDQ